MPGLSVALFNFIVFLAILACISPYFVRVSYRMYESLETYHELSGFIKKQDGKETFLIRVWKLGEYSLLGALLTTVLVLLYAPLGGRYGVGITLRTALGMSLLTVLLNFSIGLASFAHRSDEVDQEGIDNMKRRLHSFGLSFMLSLYFLAAFGYGLNILNGNIPNEVAIQGVVNRNRALSYGFISLFAPFVSALLSETVLVIWGVPNCLTDPLDIE